MFAQSQTGKKRPTHWISSAEVGMTDGNIYRCTPRNKVMNKWLIESCPVEPLSVQFQNEKIEAIHVGNYVTKVQKG